MSGIDAPACRLAHTPTPLEPMPRLSAALGGPAIYVKRDDCTGLATGGNKTRKLEFLMADAAAQHADVIVTQGAVQSNHVRQTAAAAAKLGYRCHALLEERLADEPDVYAGSGNVFLDDLFGASLERRPAGADMDAEMQAAAEALREAGHRPYVIPGGGSNTVGARGYVACMEEILADARRQDLRIDHLVHATGSAGTQAGLVAGRAAAGSDIPIHGISVRFDRARQEAKVHDLAQALARELGAGDIPEAAVSAYDGYVGPGYGQPTDGMVEAIGLVARTEGLLLDPVYSGKGMAGLIDLIRQGRFDDRENVVFLHTGGAVSLFGYTWAFPGAERSAGRPAAV
jgi:L-cysteate sulfo-lyase